MQECQFDTANLSLVFHMTVPSCRNDLDRVVGRIMQIVQTLPCACGALDDVELALSEALANAIIHGNQDDPSKQVEICGACEGLERLLLVIIDERRGFDPKDLPDPTVAQNITSTHGRGVFLITRLMDGVEFRLGGRQTVLRKKRS